MSMTELQSFWKIFLLNVHWIKTSIIIVDMRDTNANQIRISFLLIHLIWRDFHFDLGIYYDPSGNVGGICSRCNWFWFRDCYDDFFTVIVTNQSECRSINFDDVCCQCNGSLAISKIFKVEKIISAVFDLYNNGNFFTILE